MRLYKFLNERNILNVEEINNFLDNLNPANNYTKKWIYSNLRTWLINNYKYVSKVKTFNQSMPLWAEKAIKNNDLYKIEFQGPFIQQINHVIDYLNTIEKDLNRLSVADAFKKTKEWDKKLQNAEKTSEDLNGINIIYEYNDGFKWVKVFSAQALEREGSVMKHCVGGYYNQVKSGRLEILSLRDGNNNPHVTIEYRNKDIKQIKGKTNGPILEKYIKYVKHLLSGKIIKINKIDEYDLLNIGIIVEGGKWYNLNNLPDGFVINRRLDLSERNLTKLPNLSKVIIKGDFYCNKNRLTSLQGAPKEVNGDFYCSENNLTSLQGAPKEVGRDFSCSSNNLTSLQDAPREVKGSFDCADNKLTSLQGAPQKVEGGFYCNGNNLTSLQGAPKEVSEGFDCSGNKLTSLQGAPKEVGGYFSCSYNNLTSLQGAPKEVGGFFSCSKNKLTSLQGAPKEAGRGFYCSGNKVKFIEEDVLNVCKVKGQIKT